MEDLLEGAYCSFVDGSLDMSNAERVGEGVDLELQADLYDVERSYHEARYQAGNRTCDDNLSLGALSTTSACACLPATSRNSEDRQAPTSCFSCATPSDMRPARQAIHVLFSRALLDANCRLSVRRL